MRGNMKSGFEEKRSLNYIKEYLSGNKVTFLKFFAAWEMEAFINVIIPIFLGILVDEIVYHKNVEDFLKVALVVAVISVFMCILYYIIYTFYIINHANFAVNIKEDIFKHLCKVSLKELAELKDGTFINLINNYAEECVRLIDYNIIYSLYCSSMIILLAIYIFSVHFGIGIFVFCLVIFSTVVTLKSGKKIIAASDEEKKRINAYKGWFLETLNGAASIKLMGGTESTLSIFETMNREVMEKTWDKEKISFMQSGITGLSNCITQILLLAVCAFGVVNNVITLGTFTVLYSFYKEVKQNILWLNGYYIEFSDRLSCVKYLSGFLEKEEEENSGKGGFRMDGDIVFENVSFSYDSDKQILKSLNMRIKRGESTAIVGASGSGKTTIFNLLLKFYLPEKGKIRFGNIDINEIENGQLREKVGIVLQYNHFFDGTIRENMNPSDEKQPDEKILQALKRACLLEEILNLPDGLDTRIGSGGVELSGGQQQRLAVARALLREPEVLLLDESSSALDSANEESLLDTLKEEKGKTIIFITHRTRSALSCKNMIVMENGMVTAAGKTSDIIRENSYVRKLFGLQVGEK